MVQSAVTYDPTKVVITINGVVVKGCGDDLPVVERDTNRETVHDSFFGYSTTFKLKNGRVLSQRLIELNETIIFGTRNMPKNQRSPL